MFMFPNFTIDVIPGLPNMLGGAWIPIDERRTLGAAGRIVIASAALAVVGYIVIHWPGLYAGRMTQKTIVLGLTIAAGTGTYFGTASLLRSRELAELREVRRSEQSRLD